MSNAAVYKKEYDNALLQFGALCADNRALAVSMYNNGFLEQEEAQSMRAMADLLNLDRNDIMLTAYYLYMLSIKGVVPTKEEYFAMCHSLGRSTESALPLSLRWSSGRIELSAVCRDFLLARQPELPQGVELYIPIEETVLHNNDILEDIVAFVGRYIGAGAYTPAAMLLRGEQGSGKTFLLEQAAYRLGGALLTIAPQVDVSQGEILLASTLYNAFPYIANYDNNRKTQVEALQKYIGLVFIDTQKNLVPSGDFICSRELQPLDFAQRKTAFELLVPSLGDKTTMAAELPLSIAQIMSVVACVSAESIIDGGDISTRALKIALAQNTPNFDGGAELLSTNKTLADIVLPQQQMDMLTNICSFAQNHSKIYDSWGFGEKIAYGKGISVLFYGASGTGKTLAATAIANEIGKPLYRVDLSQVTSKYVGETQKNIGKIFDTAQRTGCILFFDEADALFSRRSDGGDAQDKYSNGEIAYLLQKTEQFEGITILATNLLQNFDEAFRRRIGFMIRFTMPDVALRQRLWQNIFPVAAPCDEIDFDFLAREFELSGAGIKNSAVYAAFLAGASGDNITMRHVILAVKNEYDKLGKTIPHQVIQMYLP